MKKWYLLSSFLLLSGCSLDSDAARYYVSEEKLEAAISVSDGRIQVETAPGAHVSVSFWQDGMKAEEVELKKEREGVFSAEQKMAKNGIYFVKADIKTDTQHIMPTKKIVTGKHIDALPEKPAADVKSHH